MSNANRRHRPWGLRRARWDFRPGLAIGAVGVAVLFCTAGPAFAAHETKKGYHEALEAGQVVPLEKLIERIRRDYPGRILKVGIEHESHGGVPTWVYEVKILTPDGHVLKLEFDAGSMELLELKGRPVEPRDQGES